MVNNSVFYSIVYIVSSHTFKFLTMGEQAMRYFLHPDFAAGCLLKKKETERKRLLGHLINQLQLRVLLDQIFKVAGLPFLYTIYWCTDALSGTS